MPDTLAIDVDLGRIHAFSTRDGRVCYEASDFPWDAIRSHDLVLVEVAGTVDTSSEPAQAYNRRRWTVGNLLMCGRLWAFVEHNPSVSVLVSPAEKWTMGYKEKQRNVIAGTAGQDNHDIRSCREMIFFHRTNPENWVPFSTYYTGICTSQTRAQKAKNQRKATK